MPLPVVYVSLGADYFLKLKLLTNNRKQVFNSIIKMARDYKNIRVKLWLWKSCNWAKMKNQKKKTNPRARSTWRYIYMYVIHSPSSFLTSVFTHDGVKIIQACAFHITNIH
jgi:hypothetical protein